MACYPGQPKDTDFLSDPELDEDSLALRPHSTQSTIKWLEDNYHYEDSICLPRSTIYEHYLDFCQRDQLQPVNAASFGKIIRQQFPSLTTRRLGTRGQSKYHYYGLGIKPTSLYFTEDYLQKQQNQGAARKEPEGKKTHAYYQSKDKPSAVLPPFPDVKILSLDETLPREKMHTFMVMYRAHCQRILDTVVRANFSEVENFLLHFWQGMPPHLLSVLSLEVVVDLVALCDSTLYKVIIDVLITSPLQNFPESLSQEVLKFSAMLKPWLESAMKGLPDLLKETKFRVAGAFTRSLKRQTSLMHLAQAARNALRSEDSLLQLRQDWGGLDLHAAFAHTLYTIQPLNIPQKFINMVPKFVREFADIIDDKSSIEDFVLWIEQIMNRCINEWSPGSHRSGEAGKGACNCIHVDGKFNTDFFQPQKGTVGEGHTLRQTGQTFLLTWKFFTSKIVREFTLQSAPSFGTFHLLHMLVDDYIVHYLESWVDKEQHQIYSDKIALLKQEEVEDIPMESQYVGLKHPPAAVQVADVMAEPRARDFSMLEDHIHQQTEQDRSTLATHSQGFEHLTTSSQPDVVPTATPSVFPTLPLSTNITQPSPLTSLLGLSRGVSSSFPLPVGSTLPPLTMTKAQLGAHESTTQSTVQRVSNVHDSLTHTQLHLFGNLPIQTVSTSQSVTTTASMQLLQGPPTGTIPSLSNTASIPGLASLSMPLTHPIATSLQTQMSRTGSLPFLPTIPTVYPYSPYASIPAVQNFPSQPVSNSVIRVNAPGFATQSLVSVYPSSYRNTPANTDDY